ncbi:MAG: SAM-dependent methyltransferase [Oscillospiraceae bacterium]|nr:SAM-dependent methyltransferase [Oscillospiraceae bacterium]
MRIPLSPRLLSCSSFVHTGDRVADIGCDHGYLGIYLLTEGIAASVIASDVNEGPLQSALKNADKYGVRDRMSFYLSDGVRNIPRDFDVMVCAGMGADTMISILDAAPWLKDSAYRLILQCQSKTPMLRQYLDLQGWYIHKETVLRDGRFLYTVMEVVYQPDHTCLLPWEYHFPPALLINPVPETAEYYQQICTRLRRAVMGRGENTDTETLQTLQALEALSDTPKLHWLKEETK